MSETTKKTFGKYEGISHLGSGAMGVVWKAQDPLLGRIVAVKTISAALGSDNENKERFLREARAAAQLNHPNIITVFEFGQADNELYMAMELLEGKDLKELIAAGNLTFDQKLNIMEQMADGLAYAHSRDVIHRDLKPGNVHVQPNGQVKILDFGLARLGNSDLTKTGVVMGTPNYMSPEQVMGEKTDARADVFSSGGVFYELLTGHKPFDAESVHATLYQVVHREPAPARQWDPRLPDAVVAIIETAMTKSAAGRYKDASALRDAIRAFRYGEEPELIVLDESTPDAVADALSSDATAIAPSAASLSGIGPGSASTYRSYGPSGSVAPSAGLTGQYGSARSGRSGRSGPVSASIPGLAPGPGDSQVAIGPATAPPASHLAVKVASGVAVLLLVAFLGYFAANRGGKADEPSGVDTLAANLVETQLDLARRSFADKDFKQATEQVERVLKLDPTNPEALALREQVESVAKEIDTWVQVARDAVKRGDMASASSALGRVMIRDPNHPAVAELSGDLNASFSARAEEARGEMEKARADAEARPGIAEEPAYAEAQAFVTAATQSMTAGQFTAATQTFMEARDAFDRARRSLESLNAEIARSPRALPPASSAAAGRPAAPVGIPDPPIDRVPAPPAAVPEGAAPTGIRDFGPGPTEVSGLTPQEFTGKFEFEVSPSPLRLGTPFRVRVFLRNEGAKDVSLTSLKVTVTRNGEPSSPEAELVEENVNAGERQMIAEVPGRGSGKSLVSGGTRTWVMKVEAVSERGERVRGSLTMKQP